MHKNSPFWNKKCKNFLGRGTPPPRPYPPLQRLDLRVYGAQAQRDTPEKNPSYGLGRRDMYTTRVRRAAKATPTSTDAGLHLSSAWCRANRDDESLSVRLPTLPRARGRGHMTARIVELLVNHCLAVWITPPIETYAPEITPIQKDLRR